MPFPCKDIRSKPFSAGIEASEASRDTHYTSRFDSFSGIVRPIHRFSKKLRDSARKRRGFHSCEYLGLKRAGNQEGARSWVGSPSDFRSGFRFHFLGFWVCALLFTSCHHLRVSCLRIPRLLIGWYWRPTAGGGGAGVVAVFHV